MDAAAGSKPTKILFVDDEENILRSLSRLLIDEDFEVFTASSGREGLAILEREPDICLIVSDQRMPEMTGVEFLEKARALLPDAIRLVLTGYADVHAAVDAINRGGASRYIAKPWKDEEFIQILREAAERHRLAAENRRLTAVVRRQNEELTQWNSQLEMMVQEQTLDIQNKNKELEKLNEQLKKNFRRSIESFSSLIEMREKSLSSHGRNVASLAREIAAGMKREESEINNILVAGLLHDIGKIGVPDSVLLKTPDEMNESEFAEYRRHAVRGQTAVAALEGFEEIGFLIRHHHEQVDGAGFPDGLKHGAIPLGSRILAIADAFDRIANAGLLTAESCRKARAHIEFYSDTRFDRSVFHTVDLIIGQKIEALEKQGMAAVEEIEMHPTRLSPGMTLTRDVRSGTGLLVLARGIVLTEKIIGALRRYYSIDPPRTGVFVKKDV